MASSGRRRGGPRSMKFRSPRHQRLHLSSHSQVGEHPEGRRVHETFGRALLPVLAARRKIPGVMTWLLVCVTLLLACGEMGAAVPQRLTEGRRRYSVEKIDAVVKEVLRTQRENRFKQHRDTRPVNRAADKQDRDSSLTLAAKEQSAPGVPPDLETVASSSQVKGQDAGLTAQLPGFQIARYSQNSSRQPSSSAKPRHLRPESEASGRSKREPFYVRRRLGVLSPEQEDMLGTLVGEVMACEHIPGLSLGIVKGDERQSEGYGVADMETARPVDRNTLFGIGSNTKAFAAATLSHVMQSMAPGKQFTWDTPLAEVLKDFQMPDKVRTAATTLSDILSHRTGLGSADIGLFAGFPLNMTTKDFASRLRFLPEVFPFRDRWHYSNILYGVVVSLVCETLAGAVWSQLVRDAICRPIGMDSTVMTSEIRHVDNVALPYILRMTDDDMFVQQDLQLFNIHPLEAAGAMMSSASDMTLWMKYLLQVLDNPSTSAQQSLKSMFVDRVSLPSRYNPFRAGTTKMPVEFVGYALGWMSANYRNATIYQHLGDMHGYSSCVTLEPDDSTGVFVVTNGPSSTSVFSALESLTYYVLDVLRGREPWVNVSVLCPAKKNDASSTSPADETPDDITAYDYGDEEKNWDVNAKKFLRPVEDYEGIYGHGLLGDVHIIREKGRNVMRMELGRHLVADLVPTDQESVLSAVARGPLTDTKEWEKARPLLFKMADEGPSARVHQNVSGDEQLKEPGLTDRQSPENKPTSESSIAVSRRGSFSEVHFVWELEVYVFRRDVRFDTALNEQQPEPTVQETRETPADIPASTYLRTETSTHASTEASIMTPTEASTYLRTETSTHASDASNLTSTETSTQAFSAASTQASTEESDFENTSLSAASIAKDASNRSSSTSIKFLFVLAFVCMATSGL